MRWVLRGSNRRALFQQNIFCESRQFQLSEWTQHTNCQGWGQRGNLSRGGTPWAAARSRAPAGRTWPMHSREDRTSAQNSGGTSVPPSVCRHGRWPPAQPATSRCLGRRDHTMGPKKRDLKMQMRVCAHARKKGKFSFWMCSKTILSCRDEKWKDEKSQIINAKVRHGEKQVWMRNMASKLDCQKYVPRITPWDKTPLALFFADFQGPTRCQYLGGWLMLPIFCANDWVLHICLVHSWCLASFERNIVHWMARNIREMQKKNCFCAFCAKMFIIICKFAFLWVSTFFFGILFNFCWEIITNCYSTPCAVAPAHWPQQAGSQLGFFHCKFKIELLTGAKKANLFGREICFKSGLRGNEMPFLLHTSFQLQQGCNNAFILGCCTWHRRPCLWLEGCQLRQVMVEGDQESWIKHCPRKRTPEGNEAVWGDTDVHWGLLGRLFEDVLSTAMPWKVCPAHLTKSTRKKMEDLQYFYRASA